MRYPVPLRYCLFCHVSFVSFTKICFKMFALGKHGHFLSEEAWSGKGVSLRPEDSFAKNTLYTSLPFLLGRRTPQKCTATLYDSMLF